MKFLVDGINCQNCANLIKNSLKDEFGDITVDVQNKIVECEISQNQITNFIKELEELEFKFKEIVG